MDPTALVAPAVAPATNHLLKYLIGALIGAAVVGVVGGAAVYMTWPERSEELKKLQAEFKALTEKHEQLGKRLEHVADKHEKAKA